MKKKTIISGLALLTAMIGLSTSQSQSAKAAAPDKTATVNYVKGYGIVTWRDVQTASSVTGHYLPTESQWLVNTTVTGADGQPWYLVGNNEWASSKYYDLGGENSVQDLDAVIKIEADVDSRGTETLLSAVGFRGNKATGRVYPNMEYKVQSRRLVRGEAWYELGKDQWLRASMATIKTEKSRGNKLISEPSFITNNQ
ncbi:hypothetical protein [Holzapfeliella floricola]|uniref:Surface layer protein A domain-containing protein n=1 Tax=Holzapfeliella floricola DSM 23037 = JCM 16512 TaxID=1423744 RepID=A0A0R2DMC1_9LACO|nr:hypothetical protein [Holzapfeliella floricola]KRN04822.1 hypothetical protein FC86_GL001179 [Holzapfeliella floricola DSM 23037 = JCM 16512]